MAHHKRKKSKRSVRCTLCTKHRWLGNGKDRQKAKYRRKLTRPKQKGDE